ncbi:hypothetical protein niasHT_013511 [Heterodera trifolii]|uniref:Uncharacterized protein n=1 Tax=Heterodera trifolii TaxID=157864 RepID=A0ABD2LCW1_9BILA
MRVQSIKSCLVASAFLCLVSAFLIGFASLTPGWRSIKSQIRLLQNRTIRSFSVSTGLFGFLCSETEKTAQSADLCSGWANNVSLFERIVSILCVFGALVGLFTFLWSLIILFDLFSGWENKPRWALPALAFSTFSLASVAAVIYLFSGCSENDNFVAHLISSPPSPSSSPVAKCSLHYSFFVLLVGCFISLLSFFSSLMVMLLKKRLVLGTNLYY